MAKFDETTLLQLGNLTEENGRIYAHIDACVPVEELHHQRIEHNILIIDLQTVARKKSNLQQRMLLSAHESVREYFDHKYLNSGKIAAQ